MNSDVEQIKSRLNIVDVLGEYIRLDKAGANWRAVCPFHNEKSPSFMVSEEKQIWHCFGCQKGGDVFGFVMEMEGLEFQEALKNLAEKAGVQLQSYNPKKAQEKNKTSEILELATKFYETQLWKGEGQKTIMGYLRDRGLNDETIKEFRLGYAPPGWRNALNFLVGRGYSAQEILQTGLIIQKEAPMRNYESDANLRIDSNQFYDRFRERIIFPVSDYSGKVLGYSARVAPGGDESQAKYVNSPETDVYHKSRVLYGLDRAKAEIKNQDFVLLVEGQMDVIASHQAGIKNTVAVSGTALTQDQITILKRYTKNIKMFFDMDSAGETATKKSVKLCLANDMSVRIVSLESGKDAADMAREDPVKLQESVAGALPAMEYFFKKTFEKFDRNNVEDKKKITEELFDIIVNLENEVEKNHWVKKLADELSVSESALTDELKKINLKGRVVDTTKKIENKQETKKVISKKEMLTEELIGLMLAYPAVWKKVLEDIDEERFGLKDSLFDLMLEKGMEVNFNFGAFTNKIADQREMTERAQNIFSQKKYRLDLNNNSEEIIIENPVEELKYCVYEIKKEEKREELSRISLDLKVAEERGDNDAKMFLRQESNRLTKELHELSQ